MIKFIAANWVWIALIVGMLAMHGRGGCGMHGHRQHKVPEREPDEVGDPVGERNRS